jgi:hypothetical protein
MLQVSIVRCALHVAHHIVRADRWESEWYRINRGCDGMQNGAQRATWWVQSRDAAQSMAHATVDVQHAACNIQHAT